MQISREKCIDEISSYRICTLRNLFILEITNYPIFESSNVSDFQSFRNLQFSRFRVFQYINLRTTESYFPEVWTSSRFLTRDEEGRNNA